MQELQKSGLKIPKILRGVNPIYGLVLGLSGVAEILAGFGGFRLGGIGGVSSIPMLTQVS